jgi:uncharacterized protein with ParB-like and HNH nuclease domain
MENINLEPKIVGDIEGTFYVPAYQRGYRWEEEVNRLLDDLNEIPEGKQYSLQPIVVKNIQDKRYELIDGQQRLTTIFLILSYINNFIPYSQVMFSLEYDTRKGSKIFLEEITSVAEDYEAKNIDEYFIIKAFQNIKEWFNKQVNPHLEAINLYKKLSEKIKIIWYEVDSKEDSVSLFTRLNIGRIPLTNAELVKALFLSRDNGIDDRKQLEIATKWDIIEKELHNDSFWYFITNDDPLKSSTRIELIFDLMASKHKKERENFFTFFYFEGIIKHTADKGKIWTDILRHFQRLKEWYENTDIYHKIGYLIASDSSNLQELILKSENTLKSEFQNYLNELIAESINFSNEYSELTYERKNDYISIEKLLLLFNVETVRKKLDDTMRFPFDRHKQKGNWSLEHIHAQNSQGLNKKEQWIKWLELHKISLQNINDEGNEPLLREIENIIDTQNITGEVFNQIFDKVTNILSEEGSIDFTHSLSNLALIGQFENSALNNSTFAVKRNKIIKMDKESDYIPVCTRRVFLKYYTPSESSQLHFWGSADRKGYINEMDTVLREYLQLHNRSITHEN